MATLGMEGPFDLTVVAVDREVKKVQAGHYALGRVDKDDGKFIVTYVGRSDSDLPGRIKDWVDRYTSFKYSYADSEKAAFEKECKNYHDFSPPDNKVHPAIPDWTSWVCPYC